MGKSAGFFRFWAWKGGDAMGIQAFPVFVGVRLTWTEKMLLDRLVAAENTSTSSYIRERIVQEAIKPLLAREGQDEGKE
jgi:hypothetical protein